MCLQRDVCQTTRVACPADVSHLGTAPGSAALGFERNVRGRARIHGWRPGPVLLSDQINSGRRTLEPKVRSSHSRQSEVWRFVGPEGIALAAE